MVVVGEKKGHRANSTQVKLRLETAAMLIDSKKEAIYRKSGKFKRRLKAITSGGNKRRGSGK